VAVAKEVAELQLGPEVIGEAVGHEAQPPFDLNLDQLPIVTERRDKRRDGAMQRRAGSRACADHEVEREPRSADGRDECI